MSFDADEEILQDFLVEAGEILELLSEQLVDLEQRPDDKDLLNAIFRGFHTVKGGAGFLQLNPLVDCCHAAENVFDTLRNGHRQVNPDLMDVVLQALDSINEMFERVRSGAAPEDADPAIIERLHHLAKPASQDQVVTEVEEPAAEGVESAVKDDLEVETLAVDNNDITDDEFELLLDALDEERSQAAEPNSASSPQAVAGDDDVFDMNGPVSTLASDDEITEDEFEALLDQIHGKRKVKGTASEIKASTPSKAVSAVDISSLDESLASGSDELISDSEFEELLDRLHGKGKHAFAPERGVASSAEKPAEPVKPATVAKASVPSKAAKSAAKAEPTKVESVASPEVKKVENKEAIQAEATVRVDTKRLDDIMNMVGELVLVRNRLVRLGLKSTNESMAKEIANLDVVTGDLQASVMKTRMQPIKKVFGRFPRVVRDLARQLKKEINLELRGEETDLDKNLVEALADPLVHLVRNAVDHGIEMPGEREQSGKNRVGTVVLSAEQEGDHILLTIQDDGGGMDANVLRRKAVEKGVMDQDAADRLTESECFNLIFAPGFSTKDVISDVSGRGVGMDVVKTKINQLNGTISITSQMGKGTSICIKVPLTLAIMPTLMVMLKNQAFAFPLVNVNEIFHLDLTQTNIVDGQEVVIVREKPIPLFYLKRWLVKGDHSSNLDDSAHVVVVSVGNRRVGFVVDQLIGQEEVVIKSLGKMLHGTAGVAGATVTGDGRIALILDIPSMLSRYATRQSSAA
jgi:two-component system chemotaxis sensor kinase CheA